MFYLGEMVFSEAHMMCGRTLCAMFLCHLSLMELLKKFFYIFFFLTLWLGFVQAVTRYCLVNFNTIITNLYFFILLFVSLLLYKRLYLYFLKVRGAHSIAPTLPMSLDEREPERREKERQGGLSDSQCYLSVCSDTCSETWTAGWGFEKGLREKHRERGKQGGKGERHE